MDEPKDQPASAPEAQPPEQAPEQAAVPRVGGDGGSKRKRRLWWVLIILLILALAGAAFWWFTKDDAKAPTDKPTAAEQAADEAAASCDEGFTAYDSPTLGFGFCYPEDWGTVSENDAKFAAADTGSRWRLSFSAKSAVNLGAVTSDWTTTVPRDGVCVDPAQTVAPNFAAFSTAWQTVGSGTEVDSASRGLEKTDNVYLVEEYADNVLTNGVCMKGYTIINAPNYPQTTASYSAEWGGGITTPAAYMATPDTLISPAERAAFITFVKSVHAL